MSVEETFKAFQNTRNLALQDWRIEDTKVFNNRGDYIADANTDYIGVISLLPQIIDALAGASDYIADIDDDDPVNAEVYGDIEKVLKSIHKFSRGKQW
jgi:hypothetical protein